MASPDYITINGVSSNTLDLWCDTPPVPPLARQKYTSWDLAIDENGISPDDVYENLSYTVKLYRFKQPNDLDNAQIYAFLKNGRTLEISRLSGYYFKIKSLSVQVSGDYDNNKIIYAVTFTLSPFKYLIDNEEITAEKGGTIQNTGTRFSRPVYKITGTGSINLIVNGETLTINNDLATVDGIFYVDCERMLVYNSANQNLMPKTSGKLPFLAVGTNSITWTGNVTSVKVTKNERCY